MNKQLWDLYKDSERGKKCIELFDPEKDDIVQAGFDILQYSANWGGDKTDDDFLDHLDGFMWLWGNNLSQRGYIPKEWTRESFSKMMEEFDIVKPKINDKQELEYTDDGKLVFETDSYLLKNSQYRDKAASINLLSLLLYYSFDAFKPILLPRRFDIIQKNCDALGIEMPDIPRTKDYKAYLTYYYDICLAWNEFQDDNQLSDAELCACIYDFANMLQENKESVDLPKPTNVWLTGASGKGDFAFLDSLGKDAGVNEESIWACNERTRRGDIIVLYCTSPRSCIHSIWRSNSGGIFNPFDYYHCRTTVCDGVLIPNISFNDLKKDEYMAQVPIVRRNLQGINGIELSAKDYAELMRMVQEKGGDITKLPQLFEGTEADFGEIKLEKNVEEQILIPMLKRLGYTESDWTRQLSQKAGRKEKAIPDFVFFPKGEKHFENAPMIIEAKLDMAPVQELLKAFKQGLSYARMLRSSIMGICDKERLILYKVDKNGGADRSNPIFEDHWVSIYSDAEVGARLNHLIGREVIVNL